MQIKRRCVKAVGRARDRHIRRRKSRVLAELRHRGRRVIDSDDLGWIVEAIPPAGLSRSGEGSLRPSPTVLTAVVKSRIRRI